MVHLPHMEAPSDFNQWGHVLVLCVAPNLLCADAHNYLEELPTRWKLTLALESAARCVSDLDCSLKIGVVPKVAIFNKCCEWSTCALWKFGEMTENHCKIVPGSTALFPGQLSRITNCPTLFFHRLFWLIVTTDSCPRCRTRRGSCKSEVTSHKAQVWTS